MYQFWNVKLCLNRGWEDLFDRYIYILRFQNEWNWANAHVFGKLNKNVTTKATHERYWQIDCKYNAFAGVACTCIIMHTIVKLSPGPTRPNIFPIVHDRDKLSNRDQPETNRNDENAACDYFSEYLRMCFRLHEDSSRPFLNVLRTFCERSNEAED